MTARLISSSKKKFKNAKHNKKQAKETLRVQEILGMMEVKEEVSINLNKVLPESRVFILDPTNYIDMSTTSQFTPEQSWAIAMIRLAVNDVLKIPRNTKDYLNKASALGWFCSQSTSAASYRFCCDLVNLDPDYFYKFLQESLYKISTGEEKTRRMRSVGNQAASGRYFISR